MIALVCIILATNMIYILYETYENLPILWERFKLILEALRALLTGKGSEEAKQFFNFRKSIA